MQKIYITGGTGYVGSRVALALSEKGVPVVVIDKVPPEERGLQFPSSVEFRHHDLTFPDRALEALAGADIVLHLAANIGSLTYMHTYQADIMRENSAIDSAVYPAFVKNKIKTVIYSSSSMVFQGAKSYPYKEADLPSIPPPTNAYGFSKLIGEYFCKTYLKQYELPYVVIRYHNIYGPGEDSKGSTPGDIHVIPALLEKVLNGQYPLVFLGNPEATRPFVFVDDAVRATVRIIEKVVEGDTNVLNNDFNIGSDSPMTILALGEKIWSMFGDKRPFAYTVEETLANTALRRECDMSKIKNIVGWTPQIQLEEGLTKTAEWVRNRK